MWGLLEVEEKDVKGEVKDNSKCEIKGKVREYAGAGESSNKKEKKKWLSGRREWWEWFQKLQSTKTIPKATILIYHKPNDN